MGEFDSYLEQIKEGKLNDLKRNEKKEYDFNLLMKRTGLSIDEAVNLVNLALLEDDDNLRRKLLSYAKVNQ